MDHPTRRPIYGNLQTCWLYIPTLFQPRGHNFLRNLVKGILLVLLIVSGMIMLRHGIRSQPLRGTEEKSFTNSPVRPYRHPMGFQYDEHSLPINVNEMTFNDLNLPPKTFRKLTPENVKEFVIVTGCDAVHFQESMDAVASVQHHFPNRTVYYYDLGLTKTQRRQISSWCNVQLRNWQARKYPPHAATLKTYAFKPMVIREVLQEHGAALWIDASIRIMSDDWSQVYARVLETGGIFALINSGIPTFATCHPALYNYFPVNGNLTRDKFQAGSGALLMYNTAETYWSILHWWYLCSLDPKCIAPTRELRCTNLGGAAGKGPNHVVSWAKCHRFDQCAINVLFKKYFGSRANYPHNFLATTPELRPIKVTRKVTHIFHLNDTC